MINLLTCRSAWVSLLTLFATTHGQAIVDTETNTTKPMSRAQTLAMTPDETEASQISSDPGFEACNSGDLSNARCQTAMTKMLAKMTQTHHDVASDLTNVATQLTAIDSQQGDGMKKIGAINAAIYGTGSDDNAGLLNAFQKVAVSLQDIQDTVRAQATDIANKSASVRSATDLKVQNVKKVMDARLVDVEKQINTLLESQATAQQKSLVNANNNMLAATSSAQGAIASNQKAISTSTAALRTSIDDFRTSAQSQFNDLSRRLDGSVTRVSALSDAAEEDLSQLESTMKTEAQQAVNDAVRTSQTTLSGTLNSTSAALAEVRNEATTALADASTSLSAEVTQSQAEIDAAIQATRAKMSQAADQSKQGLAAFASTSNAGVNALGVAQEASGDRLRKEAQATQTQLVTVNQLVSSYGKTGQDAIKSIQVQTNSLLTPMQQSMGNRLTKQGTASGEELLRMNSAIADLLKKIGLDGNDALGALTAYISDVQSRAGDDVKFQESALSDTQSAIKTSGDLAKSKLKFQSDKADDTLKALSALLGGSIDETSDTFAEINAANAANQRNIQTQYQQKITAQQSALNRQVNEAKMSQQQGFQSLQSQQAQKAQAVAMLIADLMAVLSNVDGAAQASSGELSSLMSKLGSTQTGADSEIARLLQLIDGSESAASAGASGAEAKLNFAASAMGDQLTKALKGYSGAFSGDMSEAVAKLTQMSKESLDALQKSGAAQTAASGDADSMAKKLLTDLAKLQQSGQGSNDALGMRGEQSIKACSCET